MTNLDDHPKRQDMIEAALTGSVSFQAHLDVCRDCSALFEIYRTCTRVSCSGLERPSEDLLSRHLAIPLREGIRATVKKLKGQITYDSWAPLPALRLRDTGIGAERRLRLECDRVTLEVSAERQAAGWDFTARAYHGDVVVSSMYILRADGRELVASLQECYYWSSRQPPRRIRLACPGLTVDFGYLRWK